MLVKSNEIKFKIIMNKNQKLFYDDMQLRKKAPENHVQMKSSNSVKLSSQCSKIKTPNFIKEETSNEINKNFLNENEQMQVNSKPSFTDFCNPTKQENEEYSMIQQNCLFHLMKNDFPNYDCFVLFPCRSKFENYLFIQNCFEELKSCELILILKNCFFNSFKQKNGTSNKL